MTTKPQMTLEQHARTALQFLDHAELEFAAGEKLQGSEKTWGAASYAVTAIAMKRGWPSNKYRDRKAAVSRLTEEYNDPSLAMGLALAHKLHANFYRDFIEDEDLETDRPLVELFVRRVVAIVEESGQV